MEKIGHLIQWTNNINDSFELEWFVHLDSFKTIQRPQPIQTPNGIKLGLSDIVSYKFRL